MISVTSGLSVNFYLNSSVYHRNIFESSSKVFGNLRKSSPDTSLRKFSEILGKCSGTFVWSLGQFWKIFRNLRKVVGNLRKIIKNAVLSTFIQYKEHYMLARRYEFYVTRGKSNILPIFLPLEHKIRIFSSPCNILYLLRKILGYSFTAIQNRYICYLPAGRSV